MKIGGRPAFLYYETCSSAALFLSNLFLRKSVTTIPYSRWQLIQPMDASCAASRCVHASNPYPHPSSYLTLDETNAGNTGGRCIRKYIGSGVGNEMMIRCRFSLHLFSDAGFSAA